MKLKVDPGSVHWWYWFATLVAMIVGLTGRVEGFYLVVAISALQFAHFAITDGAYALSTQVRLVYGVLTAIALFDPTRILYWALLVGTVMVTFFGRCMIEKVLARMPWNRAVRAS